MCQALTTFFEIERRIWSALGLTSTHIWIDNNPFISGIGISVGLVALFWGVYKLYKWVTKPKGYG